MSSPAERSGSSLGVPSMVRPSPADRAEARERAASRVVAAATGPEVGVDQVEAGKPKKKTYFCAMELSFLPLVVRFEMRLTWLQQQAPFDKDANDCYA